MRTIGTRVVFTINGADFSRYTTGGIQMSDYRITIEGVGPHDSKEIKAAMAFVKGVEKRGGNVTKAHYEVEPGEVAGRHEEQGNAIRMTPEIGECYDLKSGKVLRQAGEKKNRVVEDLESDSEE